MFVYTGWFNSDMKMLGVVASPRKKGNTLYPIISKVVHRYGSFNLIIDPREHRERLMV
jgi:cytochrome c-type biogenesis protein CcmH/NrfF